MTTQFRLTILYLFCRFFQIANVLCPFKILRIGTQKTLQKPLHALCSAKLFFNMNQRTEFDAYFIDLFQKTPIMKLSYMLFKYFVLISNNNTMNPTFFPGPNTPEHM